MAFSDLTSWIDLCLLDLSLLDLSLLNLSLLDLFWLDLSCPYLTWPVPDLFEQSWLDPTCPNFTWAALAWPWLDLFKLDMSWLNQYWIDLPFRRHLDTIYTFIDTSVYHPDTLQIPSRPPPYILQTILRYPPDPTRQSQHFKHVGSFPHRS